MQNINLVIFLDQCTYHCIMAERSVDRYKLKKKEDFNYLQYTYEPEDQVC